MARIARINIPQNKLVHIGLTYIYGIGDKFSNQICPKPIWKIRCTLGEGTLWVKEHNSIYFVDIKKKKICSLNIKNKKKRCN